MTDEETPQAGWARQPIVESCWMCEIRLPVDQLMADGGSACSDVRWYCRDTPRCTQRWTTRLNQLSNFGPPA